MKNYVLLVILTVGSISLSRAQNKILGLRDEANRSITKDPADTIPQTWKTGGIYNLNFNQAALSNWAAGGDKSSLSLSTLLSLYAFYKEGKHNWDNTLDMAYGLVQSTSLGTRKADDRIDLVSKYGYDIGKKWYLSGLVNFRSQFAKGFAYEDTARRLTSNFLSPAYVLASLGLDWKPKDNFSLFLSPATARWVIVSNDSLSSIGAFGVDTGKHVRFQLGAFASITYVSNISKTASYKTKLDLFTDYLHKAGNVAVYWNNILAVKVTRLISMNLTVNLIYDNDIKSVNKDGTQGGPKVQLQEVMGIGLAYAFNNRKITK
ncbi:DUF3078 domain-containing protein [Flavitalea sp. BT771]|uniref:DUF3078 domain-containing protein n=1 Tax=Flavitalea sp. BT771 TaxID=3063329 RepID=UPI0026E1401F|nr:DUF3078 domain-containing protein [Flavitalea sp. BT771]MDO6433824.1 DUF3078 domain-containing protein [Flavitalea sp. BT771]MDV6222271.1 DUF3078 domain-containing protein [Flavitalea sp. BT771]